MKTKPGLLLLLLACSAWGRDPFSPPDDSGCKLADHHAFAWHLQGVIGQAGHYDAWLVSPAGKSLRRQVHEPLPGTAWRIMAIDARGVTLGHEQMCQPPLRLALKRGRYVEDNLPLAGTD